MKKVKQILDDMVIGKDELKTLTQFELESLMDCAIIHGKDVVLDLGRVISNPSLLDNLKERSKKYSESDILRMKDLGMNNKSIAESLNITTDSVSYILKKNNKVKPRDRYSKDLLESIKMYRGLGLKNKEISLTTGISVIKIQNIVASKVYKNMVDKQ